MHKCFWCDEEISGYKNIAFMRIEGERVPFHQQMFKDCLNEYLKSQQEPANSHPIGYS